MAYTNISIKKLVYEDAINFKGKAHKWLAGVWFMVGELAHYLSREIYIYTWECDGKQPSYQKQFGDLSEEELILAMDYRLGSKIYHQFMNELDEFDKSEFWADEAPSPKGYEDCLSAEDWQSEIAINEFKVVA
jgi:hypothetical protein